MTFEELKAKVRAPRPNGVPELLHVEMLVGTSAAFAIDEMEKIHPGFADMTAALVTRAEALEAIEDEA